jgi:hypothetical protein
MFDDIFRSKVLDERGKRAYQAALKSLETSRQALERQRENIEYFDRLIRLFKEAIETGFVSEELDYEINLGMKLKRRMEAGVEEVERVQ